MEYNPQKSPSTLGLAQLSKAHSDILGFTTVFRQTSKPSKASHGEITFYQTSDGEKDCFPEWVQGRIQLVCAVVSGKNEASLLRQTEVYISWQV